MKRIVVVLFMLVLTLETFAGSGVAVRTDFDDMTLGVMPYPWISEGDPVGLAVTDEAFFSGSQSLKVYNNIPTGYQPRTKAFWEGPSLSGQDIMVQFKFLPNNLGYDQYWEFGLANGKSGNVSDVKIRTTVDEPVVSDTRHWIYVDATHPYYLEPVNAFDGQWITVTMIYRWDESQSKFTVADVEMSGNAAFNSGLDSISYSVVVDDMAFTTDFYDNFRIACTGAYPPGHLYLDDLYIGPVLPVLNLNENFDSVATGTLPSGWSTAGTALVVDTTSSSAGNSLEVTAANVSDATNLVSSSVGQIIDGQNVKISMKWKCDRPTSGTPDWKAVAVDTVALTPETVNEDFEGVAVGSIPANWVKEGTSGMEVTADDAYSGSNSLKIVDMISGNYSPRNYAMWEGQNITGNDVDVSFKIKLNSASDNQRWHFGLANLPHYGSGFNGTTQSWLLYAEIITSGTSWLKKLNAGDLYPSPYYPINVTNVVGQWLDVQATYNWDAGLGQYVSIDVTITGTGLPFGVAGSTSYPPVNSVSYSTYVDPTKGDVDAFDDFRFNAYGTSLGAYAYVDDFVINEIDIASMPWLFDFTPRPSGDPSPEADKHHVIAPDGSDIYFAQMTPLDYGVWNDYDITLFREKDIDGNLIYKEYDLTVTLNGSDLSQTVRGSLTHGVGTSIAPLANLAKFTLATDNPASGHTINIDDIFIASENVPQDCSLQSVFDIADKNQDCVINMADFSVLASDWLNCTDPEDLLCSRSWVPADTVLDEDFEGLASGSLPTGWSPVSTAGVVAGPNGAGMLEMTDADEFYQGEAIFAAPLTGKDVKISYDWYLEAPPFGTVPNWGLAVYDDINGGTPVVDSNGITDPSTSEELLRVTLEPNPAGYKHTLVGINSVNGMRIRVSDRGVWNHYDITIYWNAILQSYDQFKVEVYLSGSKNYYSGTAFKVPGLGSSLVKMRWWGYPGTDDSGNPIAWAATGATYYIDNVRVAYADVPLTCGDNGTDFGAGDFNRDCQTDIGDLLYMAAKWIDCSDPSDSLCSHWWENVAF